MQCWLRLAHLWAVIGAGLLSPCMLAPAQNSPLKGVVWTPEGQTITGILADLEAMRDMGVDAIRTDVIEDMRILMLADSFGIALFQDLPIVRLPAPVLLDTLAWAQDILEDALVRAAPYRFARHFGLASGSDTSTDLACAYFEALTEVARQLPDAQTYYLSPFAERDRCAQAVDMVLLQTPAHADPTAWLPKWQHLVPAGLAALGQPALPKAYGLRHPLSAASQARFLETHLNTLLKGNAAAVFVYRWRDELQDARLPAHGLISASGEVREGYGVLLGIYSGEQQVFAFAAGRNPRAALPLHLIAGWLALGLLGLMYHTTPRFRRTAHRYFMAHKFYVESVANGREVLGSTTAVLMVAHALASAVVVASILHVVRHDIAIVTALHLLPSSGLAQFVEGLLARPWALYWTLTLLAAAAIAAAPLLVRLLMQSTRRRMRMRMTACFMLTVWPQWPVLLLALMAMTIPSLPAPAARRAAVFLVALSVLVLAAAAIRIVIDLASVRPRPLVRAAGLAIMGTAAVGVAIMWTSPDLPKYLTFLWHLTVRT